jgi:putative transposase
VADLAVSALAWTRLAKSVHDAGWSRLVRLLEEKAQRCGRTVVKVGGWLTSSQPCSACGSNSGSEPLDVRVLDLLAVWRDARPRPHAARDTCVEGRKVAPGWRRL